MPRAYTREPTRPDTESEQTHDDCEWLNEENREEEVLRNRPCEYRRRRAPRVTQHESRDVGRHNHSDTEHRSSDRRNQCGVGLVGILALSGCAAAVSLCLRNDSARRAAVRIALV